MSSSSYGSSSFALSFYKLTPKAKQFLQRVSSRLPLMSLSRELQQTEDQARNKLRLSEEKEKRRLDGSTSFSGQWTSKKRSRQGSQMPGQVLVPEVSLEAVPDSSMATLVDGLEPKEAELYLWLRAERQSAAARARVAPHVIMHDMGLKAMARWVDINTTLHAL
jgi:superfamily II DNA helicase RecQ